MSEGADDKDDTGGHERRSDGHAGPSSDDEGQGQQVEGSMPNIGDPPFGPGDESLLEFDFITFVLSLHRSAACHLGCAPDPDTNVCQENLPLAKQTIDILSMLQDKTQGNLTGEEERILSEILFDLRMAYIKAINTKT